MTASPEGPAQKETQKPQQKPSAQIDISTITDFQIASLILERDVSQYRAERIDELLNKIGEAKGFMDTEKKPIAVAKEEAFTCLKFESQKGAKLGEFEVAHKNNNLPDKWNHAFNILRQNNAVINSRYHGPEYQFSYWLYGEDKIYRQKRKQ